MNDKYIFNKNLHVLSKKGLHSGKYSSRKETIDSIYNKIKLLSLDLGNILNKNMRKLKRKMNLKEVEKILSEEVQKGIEN